MKNKKLLKEVTASLNGEAIQEAANAISKKGAVAFTGAGISVESGIPPFRGEGGLWNKVDPKLAEYGYFVQHPDEVWNFWREHFYSPMMNESRPNRAHEILADWESRGIVKAVVTQNVDNLHQAAGSKRVHELHGNLRELSCHTCNYTVPYDEKAVSEPIPFCPICKTIGEDGILRPNVIMFGEPLPKEAWKQAKFCINYASTVVIVGTTGEVYPAANLPITASHNGTTIIEVNPKPSAFSNSITDIFIPLIASEGLERINGLL